MDWIERFIDEILREIPKPKDSYRTRAERELRDHMETQYRDLTGAGWTPEEARAEVLRSMGKPERLQKEYKAAWRLTPLERAAQAAARAYVIAVGCVITGALHMAIGLVLFWLGIQEGEGRIQFLSGSWQDLGNLFFFAVMLFLAPYSVDGLFLHFRAGRERRPIRMVTAGLLVAWLAERAVPLLVCMVDTRLPLGPELLQRAANYTVFPIFSPAYMVMTFVGCILLGQFFGRFIERKEPQAA